MSDLAVRVWRRYGQVRLYVSGAGGEIGWYDPRTGRFDLAEPELAAEFWAAALAECDTLLSAGKLTERVLPAVAPASATPAEPVGSIEPLHYEPSPSATEVQAGPQAPAEANEHWVVRDAEWEDLANSAPGSAAQAHAAELRRRHPVLTALARLAGVRTTEQAFAKGARGEREVGRKLNRWAAAAGWQVLHAVPIGTRGTDIDHVVIGPFGLVTVNTKTTSTSVWVGEFGMVVGKTKVDYLRKSRAEARRAGALISRAVGWPVPVQPVIVFVGARRFTIRRGGPADVAVLPSARALRRWLRKQPGVLEPGQVDEIYAAARRPGTWQRSPKPRPPRPRRA
ncbi:MAG TPA: nuclease-related domain-containing protein [Streptosporangiaceae bacterium]|nr:nuclease-related domain-containing protein [Streptosporangiaceae bacterium]